MNVKIRLCSVWLVLAALFLCAPAVFAQGATAEVPRYTIDYAAETIQFDAEKYTLTDAENTPLESGASLTPYIVMGEAAPKTLTLTDQSDPTQWQTITVPARLVYPLVAKWEAGTTIGYYGNTFRYWYNINPDATPDELGAPQTGTGAPLLLHGGSTLFVQCPATETAFCSALSSLTVPALREAPDDVEVKGTPTPETITVTALAGAEYCAVPTEKGSAANATDWKTLAELTAGLPENSNPILTGLTPDTEYTVKVRYAAVNDNPSSGTTGQLASREKELTATTQKAGRLKIVPVDAEGQPFAGLSYDVWVPVDFGKEEKDSPQEVSYTLATDELKAAHGLEYRPDDESEKDTPPTLKLQLTLNKEDGTVRCAPDQWEVKVSPTIDLTDAADKRTTAITFKTADGTSLPSTQWTYTRVGDVLYKDLSAVLPTGYRLTETEKQAATAVALQLTYTGSVWTALPQNGLTLTVEAIPSPVPPTATPNSGGSGSNESTPTPTQAPTAAPTVAPTAVPTAVPAPAPAPLADPTAGRLTPGTNSQTANRTQQTSSDTTFTAKPDTTPTASPTASPKPTPTVTPARPTATATPPEDATPEDGTTGDDTTGKSPVWLNIALLALAGGGLYALWFVMFHLPKKRAEEMNLFKSTKKDTKREDDD